MKEDLDFNSQLRFLIELDKLKTIERKTKLINGSRHENDAEHSWHLAMMALILYQHSNQEIDLFKVIKMLLIHDIVEIDAGDTFAYDTAGHHDKFERELRAATRIFGLLPEDQGKDLIDLWLEYDRKESKEAKFAVSLDSLQPLIHNYLNQGKTWKKHGITSEKVLDRNRKIAKGSERLWEYAQEMIEKSIEEGYLSK
ncbi:HD domain-containing protein [Paenibacillus sp. SC116]|uniref:HD domain-containing protein n=1 Tax=Paenibacillus sp. SC116 TaxID=2968986 RepID=UPI00215B6883|nr:HD domain-containing protein [Paenibacillus sp. SC116]MCR8842068.1 HD domain-containing protein [Paenibacillus sp. SC116]